ncbi:putative Actin bundling protein [Balamuthia mandrillaris]
MQASRSRGGDLTTDFKAVIAKTYKDQAIFFLNAFWPELGAAEAENVWKYEHKFEELDLEKKKEGNDLDEFNAHRFLEFWGETKTVVALRELLSELRLDRKKRMSLVEYLLVKYNQSVQELLSRPQLEGGALVVSEEMLKAQAALEAVNQEIQKIESRKEELEAASAGSGVKAMQAKNELAQLLTQDNTALNRALLTAEAALRKAGGRPGPPGAIWWMGRELEEMKKYKPQSKGGVARK